MPHTIMVYCMMSPAVMITLQVAMAERHRDQPKTAEREPLALSASRPAALMACNLSEPQSKGSAPDVLSFHSHPRNCTPSHKCPASRSRKRNGTGHQL
mmetsp:Transcript_58771/g.96528  ORF Transcript_58771/g.96528 Transcript_58771/m.96528 type:complete len:98 (+) Transcript_58771:50-343(+)